MPDRNTARLPEPLADNYEWQLHGHCRTAAAADFFVPEALRGRNRAAKEEAAKAVCAGCPAQVACLRHALSVREPYGIWGGTTPTERVEILDRRRRRPAGPDEVQAASA
jgi:WhiB family transcriptional regulator, redox-sensing transcriptional regulator